MCRASLIASVFAFVAALWPRPAEPCTAFLLEHGRQRLVAKSYDWDHGRGLLVHNKRGVDKQALQLIPHGRPLTWRSRHASLTFNQYGRELPNGGLNDAGLVVEVLWLDETRYPAVDERPGVNELQWVQFQLDHFATVAEMVEAAPDVRIAPVHGRVHYFACDRGGACAVFEYLDARLVVASQLTVKALANDDYRTSLDHLRSYAGFGGRADLPRGRSSLHRFVRAAAATRAPPAGQSLLARSFAALDDVRARTTRWQIVYDPVHLRVHFRTDRSRAVKTVDLARFDGDCASPVQVLDVDTADAGDATLRFAAYDARTNRKLVRAGVAALGVPLLRPLADAVARYPETTRCARP